MSPTSSGPLSVHCVGDIPYGDTLDGNVSALAPEVLEIVNAGEDGLARIADRGPIYIEGRVLGLPKTRGLTWVRLFNAFTGFSSIAAIDASGAFKLGCPFRGRYRLYVIQNGRVVAERSVKWCGDSPPPHVTVDLKSGECADCADRPCTDEPR